MMGRMLHCHPNKTCLNFTIVMKCVFKKIFFLPVFWLLFCTSGWSQIGVIADTQSPIWIELLWSKPENNVEATDRLLARLLQEPVSAVFFLGDLVAIGNYEPYWIPIDQFLAASCHNHISVYAIPGNHEYSFPASRGIADFYERFPRARALVEVQTVDSVAMVLIDSNYGELCREQKKKQAMRYRNVMDSLQNAPAVRAMIVCTHQPPYTNSTGVSPDKEVQKRLVPLYMDTPKAILFLSGHSHNLERFRQNGKNFLVVGGGGGLRQPLLSPEKQKYQDLIRADQRIRFFYVIIERKQHMLYVKAKGMNTDDFSQYMEKEILRIPIK